MSTALVSTALNPAFLQPTTAETAKKLGLTAEEFDRIVQLLGRAPNFTELSVYSVMWSEHCSYKNSILWLKKLPKTGNRPGVKVLAAAGEENAGLMDLGDGLAVCFKIESHNHPSAIEPYQGAATGVGGIHRDIFTMGARPIAALNSLRFGDPAHAKTRHLLKGVVKGIGDYGNAFGVPTVGGELFFDEVYHTNPLVNAMSVGIVGLPDARRTASATASGIGNPVFIVGSATGKDGIHGATFASEDITATSSAKLPSVQVGDPFAEKLLLEATLEAIATGWVVGIQDMGAAGVACSTSEMSARGGVGMDVHLDRVPLRQADMEPFEILLSESQERMLIVGERGREAELIAVFAKWDLNCVPIGSVTDTGRLRYYWHGQLAGEAVADTLVLGGGAPVYEREQREPAYLAQINAYNPHQIPDLLHGELKSFAELLIAHPNLCSRRWVRRQYDSMVGANTVTGNAVADGAVVRIRGTQKGIAMSVDCNPRYVHADPRRGCALAVAEAARNVACAGAIPLGVTNCLNFGNPHNPEVYWQFANAILGMKDACEAFGIPVTGGNVSFYNQSPDGPVFPTPTIGLVGYVADVAKTCTIGFKAAGDAIIMIGAPSDDLGCSQYLVSCRHVMHSPAPTLDLAAERRLQEFLYEAIGAGLLRSAHDVSDGGLLITLIESALAQGLGFEVSSLPNHRRDAFWFGEAGGRVIVSVAQDQQAALSELATKYSLPTTLLGLVTNTAAVVDGEPLGELPHLRERYDTALERVLGEA
jgi:phosphoribosylformylglycinamidine synthase II